MNVFIPWLLAVILFGLLVQTQLEANAFQASAARWHCRYVAVVADTNAPVCADEP